MSSALTTQLTLFIYMFAGIWFRRRGIVDDRFASGLADIIISLILPCNIIVSFMIDFSVDVLHKSVGVLVISAGVQLVSWIATRVLFRRQPPDRRPILQFGLLCSNAGFLGGAVAEGFFGAEGLMLSSIYLIPQRIVMWTQGLAFFTGAPGTSGVLKKTLTHPCLVAVVIGMVLMISGVTLPVPIERSLRGFAVGNTALSMFMAGMLIHEISPKMFLDITVLYYSAVRLVVIPAIVWVACLAVGAGKTAVDVSVLLAAMPAASLTAVLATKYDMNAKFAASCVAVSTMLSMIAVPIWGAVLGV